MNIASRIVKAARYAFMVGLGLSAMSCNAFLPKRETPAEGQMPEAFTDVDAGVKLQNCWWEAFGSPELSALIGQALNENLTMRQMWARLDQAGATAVQAASGLYPQLSLEGNASYDRSVRTVENTSATSLKSQMKDAVVSGVTRAITQGINNAAGIQGTTPGQVGIGNIASSLWQTNGDQSSTQRVTTETKQFGLSLAASYEVDLWGRVWSERQAAKLDFVASRDDLEAAAITLSAEVADRWLRILERQAQRQILQKQVETNRTYLELVDMRFRASQVSALDVYQQRQAVAEVEKQIPLVEADERMLRHELAVLLGKVPTTELDVGDYNLEEITPIPSTGLPAELLIHRPDVRAGLARLQAADYRVATARADRLPAIRLTGGVGYSADDFANLFDDWFVNLAAGLTAPLFDGFRREAEVERTKAVVEERLADYRLTVLTAIKEVEDALVRERRQREYIAALTRQLDYARNALREAGERYRKGLNDYLPVLTSLERTQSLTRDLMAARRDLLVDRINLYRALGGSWTRDLEAPLRLSEEKVEVRS